MPQHPAPPVELVPIDKLFCSPTNPRQNDASIPHVAASLRRFGWQQPVVARRTGEVIAGNTRLKAAQHLGMTEVPVWWFDGTDLDAVAYAVADNKTHEFAQWDEAALARLLEQLRAEDSLDGVGFGDEEISRLIAGLAAEESADLDDPGAEPPPAVAVAKPGDLWILGNHRLLCGDSTRIADVHRVRNGKAAALVATDPPYLVAGAASPHGVDSPRIHFPRSRAAAIGGWTPAEHRRHPRGGDGGRRLHAVRTRKTLRITSCRIHP